MTRKSSRGFLRISLFLLWYFGGGILASVSHLTPLDLTDTFVYSAAIAVWILSIHRRIGNPMLRRSLSVIGWFLLSWILIRMATVSCFASSEGIRRFLRYLYYVPMTSVPLMSFRVSLRLGRIDEEPLPARWNLLYVPWALLTGLILTNDLHGLAFRLSPGDPVHGQYGPVYDLTLLWIAALLTASLITAARRTSFSVGKRKLWIPVIPPLAAGLYLLLYLYLPDKRTLLIQPPEMICFMIFGFWECCIRIGLIPSNVGHAEFFRQSHLSARITDDTGRTVYASARPLGPAGEDTVTHTHRIAGGQVIWTEDRSEIRRLQDELQETNLRLADETDLLLAENQLKKEQAQIAEQNRIYGLIETQVTVQTAQIAALVREAETDPSRFAPAMAKASLLTAYIKRKANLTLHAHRTGSLSYGELMMSLNESTDYLSRCGVPGFCSGRITAEELLPADWILSAYDAYEAVLEAGMPTLSGLIVRLIPGENGFTLLLAADTPAMIPPVFPGEASGALAGVTSEEEDDTVRLRLRFGEGERREAGA